MNKDFNLKRFYLASTLFALIIIILGIPFKHMGFDSDSFGLVYACWQEPISFQIFKESITSKYDPLNKVTEQNNPNSYISTLFRPLQAVMYYICWYLFEKNAYGYYLVSIIFHAFTALAFMVLISFFIPISYSFLIALIFAMHPAHFTSFIGLTCSIIPVFFLFSLSVLLFFLSLKKDNLLIYCLSGFFFLLSLLSYELPIVFPFLFLTYCLIFDKKMIKNTWIYFVVIGIYFILRINLLSGRDQNIELKINAAQRIKTLFINWHQAIKPFFGMQDSSKICISLFIIIFISSIIGVYIIQREKRKLILFYILAFFMASWPIFIANSSSRYFYLAIPFFCLIIYEIAIAIANQSPKYKNIITHLILLIFISNFTIHAYIRLKTREEYTHQRDIELIRLAKEYDHLENIKLILIGALQYQNKEIFLMMSGMTQAFRLFFNNPNLEAYHIDEIKFYCVNKPISSFNIIPIKNGYRIISNDIENIFLMHNESKLKSSMGKILINKRLSSWQVNDLSFIFDKKWIKDINKTIILSWDLANQKFIKLNTHLLEN